MPPADMPLWLRTAVGNSYLVLGVGPYLPPNTPHSLPISHVLKQNTFSSGLALKTSWMRYFSPCHVDGRVEIKARGEHPADRRGQGVRTPKDEGPGAGRQAQCEGQRVLQTGARGSRGKTGRTRRSRPRFRGAAGCALCWF